VRRSGGDVSHIITALRASLQVPDPVDGEREARVRASLRRAQSA
jgi:hypothetical protein